MSEAVRIQTQPTEATMLSSSTAQRAARTIVALVPRLGGRHGQALATASPAAIEGLEVRESTWAEWIEAELASTGRLPTPVPAKLHA